MGHVYRRKGTRFLWLKWVDCRGEEHRESSETTDEAEADAVLAEIERQERELAPLAGGLTVEDFLEKEWLPQRRRARPDAWKADYSRLKHHFLPYPPKQPFRDRDLAELATDRGEVELLDWLVGLREHKVKRDGSRIGTRTIWNIASIVRVFFADAVERKRLKRDPTAVWKPEKHLPPKEDKVPGWRARAGFSLDAVVALTTNHRIPEDRRVLYALRFLGGGLRPGESANVRWRDLDPTKRPLARLTVCSAYNTASKREKNTKTGAELNVPVHPVLRAMLDGWRAEGWTRFMGRPPTEDDFIVPRQDGTQRRVNVSYEQFQTDLDAIGLVRQRQYESRSSFRNLALLAGASEFHVNLITHPKPKQASDFYTRLEMQWPAMCAAVEAIPASAWPALCLGEAQSPGTVNGSETKNPGKWTSLPGLQMVTRTGLEPMFSA